uniref:Short-chain dehydrogenase/reductase 3 n=1 Tax=Hirondellea gigas TaxID=1518452 RepID=A0A6A7GBS4_9CRUS
MTGDAGVTGGVSTVVVSSLKLVAVLPIALGYVLDSCIRTLIPRRFKRRDIKGETMLITGGGSGLGRELAIRFASKGAYVIVWGRNEKNLQKTKSLIEAKGGHCSYYCVDVTNKDAIYSTAEQVLREFGKVDVLINNAGVVYGKNLLELSDDNITNTMNVNILSHFFTTRAFLPTMIRKKTGQIVTMSSMAGYMAVNKMTDYCSSKYASIGFNESLTMEIRANGHTGICTTLVCPYYTDTGMFSGIKSSFVPVMTPEFVADEVADAIIMQKRHCVLPRYLSIAIIASTLLPDKLFYLLCSKVFGITSGLSEFSGRHVQKG